MVREYFDKRSVWIRRSGNELKMYAPGKVKIGFNSLIEESAYSSYGNGIMMRSGKHLYIATNLHVIEAVDPRSDYSVLAKSLDGPDVGFYEITEASIRRLGLDPRDAIDVASPVPAQKNRNGNIILGRSFDPDRSKGVSRIPGGFKEFFGIEHEMSPAFIEATGANPIWTHKSFFLASSGEAEARFRHVPNTSESGTHTKQYMFISGCSGSGLARYADGKIRFAGLITLGGHLAPPKITGEDNYANDFSMAGFETSETVFEMLKDPRRIFQFDNIVPANTNGQWQTNTQKAD